MLRKDTLPHTCIHLKGYFLFAVLSWCVCIPKHEAMTKQSAMVTPQDRQNHWLAQRRWSTCVGHLAAPGKQMCWTTWGSMAKRCHVGLLPVSVSSSSPRLQWHLRENHQMGASSGTYLASSPSLYDHVVLALPFSTSSKPVATFWKGILFQNKCARADLLRISTKHEMKRD